MTREEAQSCIKTIELLRRLAYNIHGVMDVIDAGNCEKIIEALSREPSEDVRCSEIPNSSDSISRQAAIEALKNRWKKTRNYEGIGDDIAEECELYLKQLPPAQPEIIRCKECKHRDKYGCCKYWKGLAMGDIPIATDDYDFCSYAEQT